MYCVIFVVPCWPSFFRASNRGMTTVSSCTMMLAVMYGMIPSAKIDSCSNAPPLNRLARPSTPVVASAPLMQACTAV